MRIALDATGGDVGSELLIDGALLALARRSDLEVVLLGPDDQLREQVSQQAGSNSKKNRISIVHASQTVSMHESPVDAVRKKKDSTIMVGFDLVKNGQADAMVSAGNSGATLAAAIRKLGRLKGIARPGIASLFPSMKDPVMLMDIGANVDCRPQHLFQFAIMAASCSALLLNIERPRIGLLSNGEESGKGNSLVKETYTLLQNSSLNFIGNVEGRDVYHGDVDVIVCDGFVGNVSLKISEGLAEAAMQMLKAEIMKSLRAKIGYLFIRKAFSAFRTRLDYAEYGGAPLLGINGIGIICHGSSSSLAICNAIGVAANMIDNNVNKSIIKTLAECTGDSGMLKAKICGTGSCLPDRVLSNNELEQMVDTSDEWITSRTGIKTRRISGAGEQNYQLAAKAAKRALASAGLAAEELDMVLVATLSPHMIMPSCACFVQAEIGAVNAFAFDINAACSGFLYGLDMAGKYIAANPDMKILVIGSETLSARVDWQDRNTCILFGDGAGACIVESSQERGIVDSLLRSDGKLWNLLYMDSPASRNPELLDHERKGCVIQMSGRDVFKYAVRAMEDAVTELLARNSIAMNEVSLLIPHQANVRILGKLMERLGIDEEKVFINVNKYGNTSAASIPIALDEACRQGRVKQDDLILFCSFGGGFTWGSMLLQW